MKLRDIKFLETELEFQSLDGMPDDFRAVSELRKNRSAGFIASPLFTEDELQLLNCILNYMGNNPMTWPALLTMDATKAANSRIAAAGSLSLLRARL